MKYPIFLFLLTFVPLWVFSQNATFRLDSLEKVIPKLADDTTKVNALNELAINLTDRDIPKAILYANKAHDIAESLHYTAGQADSWYVLGRANWRQGNLEQAFEYYMKSLADNENLQRSEKIADCQNGMGLLQLEQQNYEAAQVYFAKALISYKKANDLKNIAKIYNNIGEIHRENFDYDSAVSYYLKGLEISEKIDDKNLLGLINNNLGEVKFHQNDFEASLDYLQKALFYNRQSNKKSSIATNLNNVGRIYIALQNYKEAEKNLKEAEKIAKEVSARYLLENYQYQIELEEAKGEWKKAAQMYGEFIIMKDSLFDQEKSKQISQLQVVFDTEQKEKENQLLREKDAHQKDLLEQQRWISLAIGLGLMLMLGFAIVLFRSNQYQRKNNRILTEKNTQIMRQREEILSQNEELTQQHEEIKLINETLSTQKDEIQEKNKVLELGLRSAQMVQRAMLSNILAVQKFFPESFILLKPRDIVSGDFYWFNYAEEKVFFAAVDCTGHGVHGAFISLVANNILNRIIVIYKIYSPELILEKLHEEIVKAFRQDETHNDDGMDIALCCLDTKNKVLEFAGAKNPLIYIQNEKINEIKGTSKHIGGKFSSKHEKQFEKHYLDISTPTMIYVFSDGFSDQPNQDHTQKFGKVRFYELLEQISPLSAQEQKQKLYETLKNWRQTESQIDDVLVAGIKIN